MASFASLAAAFSDKEKCDGPDEETQAQGATCQLFAAHIAVKSTKFTDYEVYVRWARADGTVVSYQPLTEAWTPTDPRAMNPTCTAAVLKALAGIAGMPPGPTVPIVDALYWNNQAGTWKKEIVPGRDVVLLREDDVHNDLSTIGVLEGAQEDYRQKLAKAMHEGRFFLDDDDDGGAGGGEQQGGAEEDPGAQQVEQEEEEDMGAAGHRTPRMSADTGTPAKSRSSSARKGSARKRGRDVDDVVEDDDGEEGQGTGTGRGARDGSARISCSASPLAGSLQLIPGPTRGKGAAHGAGASRAPSHALVQPREEEEEEGEGAEGSCASASSALNQRGARGRTVQEENTTRLKAQRAPSSGSFPGSTSMSTSRLPLPQGLPHKQLPVHRGVIQDHCLPPHSSSGGGLKAVISTVEAQLEAAQKAQDLWDSGNAFKRIAAVALAAEVSDMYMEAFSDELRAAVASKSERR